MWPASLVRRGSPFCRYHHAVDPQRWGGGAITHVDIIGRGYLHVHIGQITGNGGLANRVRHGAVEIQKPPAPRL